MNRLMMSEPHSHVDATVRRYLTDKVREKFPEDFHLLEPILPGLVARYSLKELLMICSVEIHRLKNINANTRNAEGGRSPL